MLSTPVFALDQCKPSDTDKQVRICSYHPAQRYVVTGLVGYPVNLQFGTTEHIKRMELAYTGVDKDSLPAPTWRGPAKKPGEETSMPAERWRNNLPIWAFHEGRSALLVVTATQEGSERAYKFELIARKPSPNCNESPATAPGCEGDDWTTSELSFIYPSNVAAAATQASDEKRKAMVAAWQVKQAKDKETAAIARLKVDVFYGQRNFAYQAKAEQQFKFLAPSQVSDNGWLTEMQWPGNVQLPTITMIDPATGDERVAPVTQQGQMQIINGTSEWFRLRLGSTAVMDIHNLAWSASRPDPGTGTTSHDVVRQVLYQKERK